MTTFGDLAKTMHPQQEAAECAFCNLGIDQLYFPKPFEAVPVCDHHKKHGRFSITTDLCQFCPAPCTTFIYGGHKPQPVCAEHYRRYHDEGSTVKTPSPVKKPTTASTLTDLARIADEVKQVTLEKNQAYGSSFEKCGDFLRILYPEGLKPEQYEDVLLQVRLFDKQMRIATRKGAFGESPYRDIAGYGLLGARKDEGE
jgi:hypothetical protein